MYLSRIMLDTTSKKTMSALNNPNMFHGAIDCAEKEGRSRKLWRIDYLHGNPCLLVLSQKILDLSSVAEQFGFDSTYEVKDYTPLLDRAIEGSVWHFKLTANPTIKKFDEKKKKAIVYAHITTEYQMKWLEDRAEKNGFSLEEDSFLVTKTEWHNFKKNTSGDNVRMLAVTYEGVLTVTDEKSFQNALINGIGREKAYGLGMLTVVK